MENTSNLVWIDLEMTGLDPNRDVILEIATIITDSNLTILEEGPSLVIHQPQEHLALMSDFVSQMHIKSGLIDKVRASTITIEQAQEQTLAFIKKHCEPDTALLCGNSIWQDRVFLWRYMRPIVDYLYYRMIDVTAIKEVVARWYPDDPQVAFVEESLSTETHRALQDIRESIEELRHYRKYFFV